MINIPSDTHKLSIKIPNEEPIVRTQIVDLPELPEERNEILDSLGKSHTDFKWGDPQDLRSPSTLVKHIHSTSKTVLAHLKDLEEANALAQKLEKAGIEIINKDELNAARDNAFDKYNLIQAQETAEKKAKERREAEANPVYNPDTTVNLDLVELTHESDYPFLVFIALDQHKEGFNPETDSIEDLPESTKEALFRKLHYIDKLVLSEENTVLYRNWLNHYLP